MLHGCTHMAMVGVNGLNPRLWAMTLRHRVCPFTPPTAGDRIAGGGVPGSIWCTSPPMVTHPCTNRAECRIINSSPTVIAKKIRLKMGLYSAQLTLRVWS